MRESIIIAVASIFVCLQSAYSQISTNELPVSIQRGLDTTTKDKTIGTIDLPVPDIKKLLQEDSLNQEKNPNVLQRTAVSIPVAIFIYSQTSAMYHPKTLIEVEQELLHRLLCEVY